VALYLLDLADDLLPVPAGSTLNTLVVLNRRLGWLPSVSGNKADLLSDYDEAIAAMVREVRTAERYVHVGFYIMSWDSTTNEFFEALAEVAARGVKSPARLHPAVRTARTGRCQRSSRHAKHPSRSGLALAAGTRDGFRLAVSCRARERAARLHQSAP
jgi:phosphatidylserine/phosphatidylglycerophosphate/cardiolipin synthase-like enzyme